MKASEDPEAMLMLFLQTTYVAAAKTGKWGRSTLECELGNQVFPAPSAELIKPGRRCYRSIDPGQTGWR